LNSRLANRSFILGCSHAAGSELFVDLPDDHALNQTELCHFNYTNSYPAILSNLLGKTANNHAIPGGSCTAMFRIFLTLLDDLDQGDVILACWTGPDRTEIYDSLDNAWLPISPGERNFWKKTHDTVALQGIPLYHDPVVQHNEYIRYLEQIYRYGMHPDQCQNERLAKIIALNHIASQRSIQVINIFSFAPEPDLSLLDFYWPVGNLDFMTWSIDRNMPRTKNWHFSLQAHREFSRFVFDAMQ
jgi:hypothetical protein